MTRDGLNWWGDHGPFPLLALTSDEDVVEQSNGLGMITPAFPLVLNFEHWAKLQKGYVLQYGLLAQKKIFVCKKLKPCLP